MSDGPAVNTDREIWRERPGDFYADSIHVTESGSIGIDCGGMVFVMPVRQWHALASVAPVQAPVVVTDAMVAAARAAIEKSFQSEPWEHGVPRHAVAKALSAALSPQRGVPVAVRNLLCNCAQILDVVKGEWSKDGRWSEWDQSIRDGITAALAVPAPPVEGLVEREVLAAFMIRNSFATGHGDTFADLLSELEWQVQERSASNEALRVALEAGRQLANVAYNICQRGAPDAGALRSLNAAQLAWDTAVASLPKQGEGR